MKKSTKGLLITSVLTISAIHGFNKYIEYTSTMKDITSSKNDKFYTWKDIKICYNVKGIGSPVLLLHDLSAETSSYEWNRLVDRLTENHRVYTLDLPGCGKSDKPKSEYVCYYFVMLLNDFIKDVIKNKTTIVTSGSSFTIAVMADKTDDQIRKIIAINPPKTKEYYKTPDTRSRFKKFVMEFPIIGNTVYNFQSSFFSTKRLIEKKYYSNPANVSTLALDYFYEGAHLKEGNGRYLQASIYGKYTNCYIIDALKSTTTPIAFIYTSKYADSIKEYKKYTKKIHMHKVDGNEKPHLEYPGAIMELLRAFLPFGDI